MDDAWLIDQYGSLDYNGLFREMESHNFHTTIAFVPWNFDRSRPDVVSLFRSHPDRFSICIHGNNHDHDEFGEYSHSPLIGQVAQAKQALARMEQFTRITKISYSPVMVFPHAVAPLPTFGVLKEYNYWGTANSQNVPLGATAPPEDPLFSLRPETLLFDNFLSLKRYSAEVPLRPDLISINAFLGNPLLFYGHQEFFYGNIGAFNGIADAVNKTDPHTEWRSLGEVVQQLYLLRRRDDRDLDVLAFSPDFYLTNSEARAVTFHVRRPENFTPPIHALMVDGQSLSYQKFDREITFDVLLGPKTTRRISITYANDLDLAAVDTSKQDKWVTILRWTSDFRDLTLSKHSWGLELTRVYYRWGADSVELAFEQSWLLKIFLLVVCSGLLLTWIGHKRAHHPRPKIAQHR